MEPRILDGWILGPLILRFTSVEKLTWDTCGGSGEAPYETDAVRLVKLALRHRATSVDSSIIWSRAINKALESSAATGSGSDLDDLVDVSPLHRGDGPL